MNYFNTSRTIILLLSLLLVIALTGLGTILYKNNLAKENVTKMPAQGCANSLDFLSRELGLSAEQKEKISGIRNTCMHNSGCVVANLRENRERLLAELAKENPDSVLLDSIVEQLGEKQEQVVRTTIEQYLAIKAVCTPEQQEKLSDLYFELMGFDRQGGHMHRHRHGMKRN